MVRRSIGIGHWALPILGAGLAVAMLFWLYRDLDAKAFLAALRRAEPAWLMLLAFTILLEQMIRGWKWRQILFDLKPIPTPRLFGAIMAGYGVAALIPLGISPLVRSWHIARLERLRIVSVLVTAAIERFVDGIVFAVIAVLVVSASQLAAIQTHVRAGLAVSAVASLLLFSGLWWLLFVARGALAREDVWVSRLIDWLADKAGRRLAGLREAIRAGILWPESRWRQVGTIGASVAMKLVSSTHFLWAGLAIGVMLGPWDYLFLMVAAGFALVLSRLVRVPGGFVIGSGLALKLLGCPGRAGAGDDPLQQPVLDPARRRDRDRRPLAVRHHDR